MAVGSLLLLDGLFPTRSHGPNPSSIEMMMGVVLAILGCVMRRAFRRRDDASRPVD